MAYQAKGNYFDRHTSSSDKAAIKSYQDQWAEANARGDEAGKAAAHAGAEAIRARYGYSGGEDGSERLDLSQQQTQQLRQQQTSALNQALEEYRNLYNPSPVTTGMTSALNAYTQQLAEQSRAYQQQLAEQNNAYQQMLAEQKAAQEAAVNRAVNSLESQKAATEQQYSELFRQLYIDKMKNRKNLDQRLAAGGVTGGAAETTALGYDTQYAEALRQGEQGRIGAIGSIDRAITDTRLTGDIAVADAAAKTAKEQTDKYAGVLKDLIDRQDALDARREAYEREDAAAQRSYAYKTAMQMIGSGIMPSTSLLESAGIDVGAADAIVAAVEAERVAQAQREAEKAAEAAALADKPTLTAAQVNAALKNGIRTPAVLSAYEYYYGVPYRQ